MDLDEFIGTDFSCLRISVLQNHFPGVQTVSQYDPYAEVHLSGVQTTLYIPPTLPVSVPLSADGAVSVGPSVIPGFAPGMSLMSSGAEMYGEPHPKPATGSRFERDHLTSSSSDADLYGSPSHDLSPPRGSDHLKSPQVNAHREPESIRKFDTSTLLHVIPEVRPQLPCSDSGLTTVKPHFHPAPSADLSVAHRSRIPPFSKSIPIPIYPSTDTSVEIYLRTPHGRGSWIIPVRGVLPWDGCTRARILQPNPSPDSYPPKDSFEGYTDLVWTHASLVAFWDFLSEMKAFENTAISFHADTSFNDDRPAYNDSVEYEPTPPDACLFDPEPSDPRVSLLLVDHIKVYCDAEFTMNVRTVLASWKYEWDEKNAAEDAFDFYLSGSQASEVALYGKESQQFQVHKIQLLRNARIPFLDHKNNGLFVC